MTPSRPDHDAGREDPYEPGGYRAEGAFEAADPAGFPTADAFEAAVDRLADPLNDPLPGRHAASWQRPGTPDAAGGTEAAPAAPPGQPPHGAQGPQETPREWYDPEGYERDWYGRQAPPRAPAPPRRQVPRPAPARSTVHLAPEARSPGTVTQPPGPREQAPGVPVPPPHDETIGLRAFGAERQGAPTLPPTRPGPGPERETGPRPAGDLVTDVPHDVSGRSSPDVEPVTGASDSAQPTDAVLPTGGRAARRRAAKGRGHRRAEPRVEPAAEPASLARPLSRVEARRAARAAKDSPAVVASRVVGELFITLGVLMLLFVTYQLWWTNVRADQIAGKETHEIQDHWAKGERDPGVFEAGQGFAIIHIPKLDVVAPIAEGISKEKVLDRGMVGHYGEGALRTAMPSAKEGNFALAGHRNTHGEPFRYVNRLQPGDKVVVETQDAYYTYEMTRTLPQTSPSNVSVIDPVPPGSGFTGPGRYITLTTCTPEFTSTYRLIVWGKMVDERPRSKGKPDALVG